MYMFIYMDVRIVRRIGWTDMLHIHILLTSIHVYVYDLQYVNGVICDPLKSHFRKFLIRCHLQIVDA